MITRSQASLCGKAVFIVASVLPLFLVNAQANEPCPPRYKIDKKAAFKEKVIKKVRLERFGVPEAHLTLIDRLPDCIACVEYAPDFPHLLIIYPDGKPRHITWSKTSEYLARQQLRSGKIKAFYIILASKACRCCGEPYYDERDDWDEDLEFNTRLAKAYKDPKHLGPDPDYLTQAPSSRCAREIQVPDMGMPKPERFAQAQCPACRLQTDEINRLNAEIYRKQQDINTKAKNLHVTRQFLEQAECERGESHDLAMTEEVTDRIDRLQEKVRSFRINVEKQEKQLETLKHDLENLYQNRDQAQVTAKTCEGKYCAVAKEEPQTREATIAVRLAGEALDGYPKYRITADSEVLEESEVTWARDTAASGRANGTGSDLVWKTLTFTRNLPRDRPRTVKVLFMNDHYINQSKDRNLLVAYAEVDDCRIASDSRHAKYGDGPGRIWLYSRVTKVFDFGPCLDQKNGKHRFTLRVVTKTADRGKAETDWEDVTIAINGDPNHSALLNDPEDDFERGALDTFEREFNYPLSEIKNLTLTYSGEGQWLCESIAFQFIKDGKASQLYTFDINTWFSSQERDKFELGALDEKIFIFSPVIE